MIEIMNKKYLTDKEASARYGYSISWFKKGRKDGFGPKYVQLKNHARILYPFEETEEWFKKKLLEKE